jgi:coproporphyrinogen III oxidase-like Fe-S oxidoreductase
MFSTRIKTHHSAMASGKKYAVGPRNVQNFLSLEDAVEDNSTIYIHVPFCNKICSFCNMRRSLQKPSDDYYKLITREIENYSKLPYVKNSVFDAVYFGGGTPTTLTSDALKCILQSLFKNLNFTKNVEVTIETTVTELTDEKIDTLGENGVTRFSVGVQTFNDFGRKQMNRIGSGEYAYRKLQQLKNSKKFTVSMDLIYNYSGQSIRDLEDDLNKICDLDLDGFSMYSLINMKETQINDAQNLANDEEMFFFIAEKMKKAGYEFLELTKMVKSDKYKYIMNRHQGADTLALGAGAGGSMNGLMMMNEISIDEYAESIENFSARKGMLFTPEYKDITIFKGDLQTLKLPVNESLYSDEIRYREFVQRLLDDEYIYCNNEGYRLTTKGVFWGNSISRALYDMI